MIASKKKKYDIETAIYSLAVNLLKTNKLLSIKNLKIKCDNPYLAEILDNSFENIKLQKDLLKFKLPSDEKRLFRDSIPIFTTGRE